MISSIKQLLKSKEVKAREARELEESIRARIKQEELDEIQAKKLVLEELRKKLLDEKLESTTPWYEAIIGAEDEALLVNRYHWNQAFIKQLIKKGHNGNTDSEVFQSFLDAQDAEERNRVIEEEREALRNSPEPWVEVIGNSYDSEKNLKVQLDWNDAFIRYLRVNGFTGATDDVVVQKWLAGLSNNLEITENYI